MKTKTLVLIVLVLAVTGCAAPAQVGRVTVVLPTATFTPSFTPVPVTPTPTFTPVPPTATPAPTEGAKPSPTPTATETPTATPTGAVPVPVIRGRIAFPVYDPARATYDIYVANADGSGREKLVEQASQPDFSSDGKKIAFRSWDNTRRGILAWVIGANWWNIQGKDWHAEAARPSWSPDDQAFVFHSREEPDRLPRIYVTEGLNYRVVMSDLGGIYGPVFGEYPAWMPDGTIVYAARQCRECGLYIITPQGQLVRRLTSDASDAAPEPSPDGKRVVFMAQAGGNWDVYIVNADGSGRRRLTTHEAMDVLPTWSPDGRWIAFISNRDGEWAIWAIRPDGLGLRKLFALGGSIDGVVGIDRANSRGWGEERISWTW